jgi:Tol biopolymer transport system component
MVIRSVTNSVKLNVVAAGALALFMSGVAAAAGTTLESRNTAGDLAVGTSFTGGTVDSLAISADGRYVVFASGATNLVADDTNGWNDIFLRDRLLGTTVRINLAPGGLEANQDSGHPAISRDGRYIAYESAATNLVSTANNGVYHIFLYDTVAKTTVHVSKTTAGVHGNGSSTYPAVSNDGRYVSFTSLATNLVAGDTNARPDVFRRDVVSNITIRASVTNAGAQGNNTQTRSDYMTSSISGDGRYVLFRSSATNLVAGDTNGLDDLFVRDCTGLTTKRVSLSSAGVQTNDISYMGKISNDGRYVVFSSAASTLVAGDTNVAEDVFIRDRTLNTTARLSVSSSGVHTTVGALGSNKPSISDDNRYVVFTSYADNLIADDTNAVADTYMRDRTTNTTTRVSLGNLGEQCDNYCNDGVVSANGLYVAFSSASSNLVVDGYNGLTQLFVRLR